jgi:hypothetical protein
MIANKEIKRLKKPQCGTFVKKYSLEKEDLGCPAESVFRQDSWKNSDLWSKFFRPSTQKAEQHRRAEEIRIKGQRPAFS